MVDILSRKSTLTATYYVETVLSEMIKSILQQSNNSAKPLASVRPFSFIITPVPTKPRSL